MFQGEREWGLFFYTLNAFFFEKSEKKLKPLFPFVNAHSNAVDSPSRKQKQQVEIPKKQKVSYVWVSQGALGQLPSYRPHHHQTWVGDGVRTPSN